MRVFLNLITAFFRWLANRNSPEAIAERKVKKTENVMDSVDKAIIKRDEDEVNRHINRMLGVVAMLAVLASGCAYRRTVYIHESDKVIFHELNGKPGWWIPESIFGRMMNKLAEAEAKEK